MKRLMMMAAVMAIVLGGVLVAGPTPASAHQTCAEHTYDYACIQSNHHQIKVCDKEKDGHVVEAWFVNQDGRINGGYRDLNGSKSPCSIHTLPRLTYAVAISVCEEAKGCSEYVYD